LRRILWERHLRFDISAKKPKAAGGKPDLLKRFEKFLQYALLESCDAILVLVDADAECPFEQVPNLAVRAAALNLNVPVAIVYARSEYETWFICSLSECTGEPIRARLGIPASVNAPEIVEDVRAAKGWLEHHMPNDRGYKETEDQAPLTHHIDLDLTYHRSRSFRRFCHAVDELIYAIDHGSQLVTPSA
jgi:hypothetical protein